ncbi:MAG TPA: tetratricopeptide repeat protein, partial [Planctomycetota bacterium]|nr:tetratricopeptide repeat protein [Planctomycetota bacterium]
MPALAACLTAVGCGTYSPLDSPYNRGVEYYDQGRLVEAVEAYRQAVDDDPGDVRAHFNLGVAYHDLGRLEEAEAAYARVLDLRPRNARARINLASLRLDQQRPDEAKALLEEAAGLDGDTALPHVALGAFHERRGDATAALSAYLRGVDADPRDAAA